MSTSYASISPCLLNMLRNERLPQRVHYCMAAANVVLPTIHRKRRWPVLRAAAAMHRRADNLQGFLLRVLDSRKEHGLKPC